MLGCGEDQRSVVYQARHVPGEPMLEWGSKLLSPCILHLGLWPRLKAGPSLAKGPRTVESSLTALALRTVAGPPFTCLDSMRCTSAGAMMVL